MKFEKIIRKFCKIWQTFKKYLIIWEKIKMGHASDAGVILKNK